MNKQIDETKSYHQIIVKAPARNTGPVKVNLDNHNVKWGFAEEYIKRNPYLEVVRIIDTIIYK